MSNANGQIILHALETLGQPAPLKDIVSTVAKLSGVTAAEVRETVKVTLSGGVQHGYVKFSNRKYSTVNYDADEEVHVDTKNTIEKKDNQPEDASRAGRRGRSSSRRRQRSVSRRSRSRRSRPRQSRSRRRTSK